MTARTGLLLVNLGTPDAPTTEAVRPYLAEFLDDPRVIDIPAPLRWLLLNLVILRTRPKKSAALYRAMWTEGGSPLLVAGNALTAAVRAALDAEAARGAIAPVEVALAMRYGRPSLSDALDDFAARGVDRIVVLPLYPQYAAATTGSTVERAFALVGQKWNVPALHIVPPFYDDTGFLDAQAAVAADALQGYAPDHVVFSFHGVPRGHVEKGDASGAHCLKSDGCCDVIGEKNRMCYRAHCVATARALAKRMGVPADEMSVTFQSRLGRAEWLRPYTDEVVPALARDGKKRLAMLSPAFVADCLETVEELGVEAKKLFLDAGGEDFRLVPCVNAHPRFVQAVVDLAKGSGFLAPPA